MTTTQTRFVRLYARDDLRIEARRDAPLAPGEIRVKVQYVGICGTELHVIAEFGPSDAPRGLGHEWSGVVEEVASDVRTHRPGDRVVGRPRVPCGTCFHCLAGRPTNCANFLMRGGALAERIDLPASFALPIPDSLGLREAALSEPLACALRGIERAAPAQDHVALVIGGGPIGLLTAVGSLHAGADCVFVSEPSAVRRDLAAAFGAIPINPSSEDVGTRIRSATTGRGADVVYEAVGGGRYVEAAIDCVRRGGTVAVVGVSPPLDHAAVDVHRVLWDELTLVGVCGIETTLPAAVSLLDAVDLAPLITHEYPLDEVDAAIETAFAAQCGKVMICPQHGA